MGIWQFQVKAEKDIAYALEEVLGEKADVISLFENPQDKILWIIQGICVQKPDQKDLEKIIASFCFEDPPYLKIIQLPDKDWLAENRKTFKPLKIADFYIYGSHEENPQWHGKIPLKIDASTAFGTGNHATTQGCLEAFCTLKAQGFSPRNPLDLGCGTGILAIALIKLFEKAVIATDLDPEATQKTRYNAEENEVASQMTAYTAEDLKHSELERKAPFDFIVANILAGPLIDMALQIKLVLSKGGYLVLSGILDHQVSDIKDAYVDPTLKLVQENLIGEWAILIFKKLSVDETLKDRLNVSVQREG